MVERTVVERTVVEKTVVERTVVERTSGGNHLSRSYSEIWGCLFYFYSVNMLNRTRQIQEN